MSDIEKQVKTYLKSKLKDGSIYFKSKYIAKDIGLSAKQVGSTLIRMCEKKYKDIKIKKWSYANSTTWRVDKV